MPKTEQNSRAEPTEDEGPTKALNQIGKENLEMCTQNADHQAVLAVIASLQADLSKAKSDICDKIDETIADMSTILRGKLPL